MPDLSFASFREHARRRKLRKRDERRKHKHKLFVWKKSPWIYIPICLPSESIARLRQTHAYVFSCHVSSPTYIRFAAVMKLVCSPSRKWAELLGRCTLLQGWALIGVLQRDCGLAFEERIDCCGVRITQVICVRKRVAQNQNVQEAPQTTDVKNTHLIAEVKFQEKNDSKCLLEGNL